MAKDISSGTLVGTAALVFGPILVVGLGGFGMLLVAIAIIYWAFAPSPSSASESKHVVHEHVHTHHVINHTYSSVTEGTQTEHELQDGTVVRHQHVRRWQ